ncbi:MAG: VOC family protein, partial [bacterium]|nr:VOC family protein [bacterium]
MSQLGQFCWNELCTTDVNVAKEFYGKVFGWQFKEIHLADMTYTIITCNDKDIAGIWQIPT